MDSLRAVIKRKEISPEDLRSYLLSMPAFTEDLEGQTLNLLSDKKAELEKADTVTDIFNFLKTQWASFLNYDIFQKIIEHYNILNESQEKIMQHDRERLQSYGDDLKAYIEKHKISEMTKILPLEKPKNGTKQIILKYDIKNTCKLARIKDLSEFVAKILGLHPSAFHIFDVEDGCVVVAFLISASVADALFTSDTVFTPQQEDEFRKASVLWLKCNGCTFDFGTKYFGMTISLSTLRN